MSHFNKVLEVPEISQDELRPLEQSTTKTRERKHSLSLHPFVYKFR